MKNKTGENLAVSIAVIIMLALIIPISFFAFKALLAVGYNFGF